MSLRILGPGLALALAAGLASTAFPAPDAAAAGTAADVSRDERELAARLARPLTLPDCIAIALKKNIPLKIAEAELQRAHGASVASLGKFLPVLTGSASEEHFRDHTVALDDTGARISDETIVKTRTVTGGVTQQLPGGATVGVTQTLGPDEREPGRTRNRGFQATVTQPLLRGAGPTVSLAGVRAAALEQHARELDLTDLQRQTVVAVKVAYYNVLRDRELLRVNQSTLVADSLLVQASDAMVEAKVASRRDVLSARIRLSDDASSVVVAERDEQVSLDLLKDVMGIPLDAAIALADTGLDARIVSLDEAAMVRRVIETHPSLRSAEYAVSHSRLDLIVARNSRWPQLDLQGSYLSDLQSSLDVLDEARSRGWVGSVRLSLPVFDRSAAGATIQRKAELAQAQDRLELLRRQLTLRVREIVRTVRSSSEEIRAIQATIEAADEKLQFATAMFNLGRASNLDITDARGDLVKARTQLVKKWVDYNSQLALLESLTGEHAGP